MQQLEFFPRAKLRFLSDFQRFDTENLSLIDRRKLIRYPDFFEAPKTNIVIQREHSHLIDRILGVRLKYVEEMLIAEAEGFDPEGSYKTWGPSLHHGVQTWIGLDLQTLQTPYSECLQVLQLLKIKPYQHVVDLGAAYGRMGIVIGGLFLKNFFTGFEYVKARVDEGNRVYQELGLINCQLVPQDLIDPNFQLPLADIYFIYDYGQLEHIDHTLKQLKKVATKRPIKIVVRGKFTKMVIKDHHPWLELKYEAKAEEMFSIYGGYFC